MNLPDLFLSEAFIRALGWTLIHSLWQGALFSFLAGLALFILRKNSASLRYVILYTCLLLIAASSAITFSALFNSMQKLEKISNEAVEINHMLAPYVTDFSMDPAGTFTGNSRNLLKGIIFFTDQYLPIFVLLWFTGMLFFMLKTMGGLIYIQRIRYSKTWSTGPEWAKRLTQLANKMGIKKTVSLLESSIIKIPVVIGVLKPVILIPLGTISNVPPEQLEAILLHELAHIRRKDFLLNIIQTVLEAIFFYHPAVWWLSKNIRQEREHICDDMALSFQTESLTYIKALTTMEEMNFKPPVLASALSGRKHQLLYRIRRMIDSERLKPGFLQNLAITVFFIAGLLVLTASAAISHETRSEPGEAIISLSGGPDHNYLITLDELKGSESGENVVNILPFEVNRKEMVADSQSAEGSESYLPNVRPVATPDTTSKEKEARKKLAEEEFRKAKEAYDDAMRQADEAMRQQRQAQEEYFRALKEHQKALHEQEFENWRKNYEHFILKYDDDTSHFSYEWIDTLPGNEHSHVYVFPDMPEPPSPDEHFDMGLGVLPPIVFPDNPMLQYYYFNDDDSADLFQWYGFPEMPDEEMIRSEIERAERDLKHCDKDIIRKYCLPLDNLDKEYHFDYRLPPPGPIDPMPEHEHGKTEKIIRQELIDDELVRPGKDYIIELDSGGLFINGEKQTKEVSGKYKKLLEGLEGELLDNNSTYKLIF